MMPARATAGERVIVESDAVKRNSSRPSGRPFCEAAFGRAHIR